MEKEVNNHEVNISDIEKTITEKILSSNEISLKDIPIADLKLLVKKEVMAADYLNEEWQIDYAIGRVMKIILTKIGRNKEVTGWRRHFSGINFLINGLIAIIPASLVIVFLQELLPVRPGKIIIFFGSVYLVGLIREKIGDKKQKIDIQKVSENIAEKQPEIIDKNQNKSSKKKWMWAGVILIILVVIIALVSNSPSKNEQDISLIKTDKSDEFSEQSENLYRNTKYNFRIKFPEGWEIKNGDGPNIIQKAVKENSSISVGVREIPAEYGDETATTKDVMSLAEFRDSTIKSIQEKFPGAKLLDYGETKLDNIPTYWLKHSAPYSVLDINVEGTLMQYQLLNKNIFYFITAGTLTSEFPSMEGELKKSIATFVIENY